MASDLSLSSSSSLSSPSSSSSSSSPSTSSSSPSSLRGLKSMILKKIFRHGLQRNRNHGLEKLAPEVETSDYKDILVMWSMLHPHSNMDICNMHSTPPQKPTNLPTMQEMIESPYC